MPSRSHPSPRPLLALALALGVAAGATAPEGLPSEADLETLAERWRDAAGESPTGAEALELARTLHALAVVERHLAKPEEARAHLEEALELLPEAAAADRTEVREALALTLQDLGELSRAEDLLRRVLDARAADESPEAARIDTLEHLALNLLQQGDYREAAERLDEALARVPPDSTRRAGLLASRARLHHTLGSHERARQMLLEARELATSDPALQLGLDSRLALAELRLGERERAQRRFEEVAARARDLHAGRPVEVIPHLNNLGALALADGEFAAARARFAEALEVADSGLPEAHPARILPLNNLGVAEQALGDYDAARRHLEAAARLQERHLPELHLRVAETRRNLARNALLAGDPDAEVHVARAIELGLELLEQLIESGSERERLNFLERFDPLSLACISGRPERIADALLASKARLLDAMLGESGGPPPDWREVRAGLPADGAFVDFCRYEGLEPDEVRFGALLLLPGRDPEWIELADEASLRRWLEALSRRLAWCARPVAEREPRGPSLTLPLILRGLHDDFWQPLATRLPPEVNHLAVAPDAGIHFIPFAALLDGEGRPLCQRYRQLTQVASGRDLLRSAPRPRLDAAPWSLLAVSDFPNRPARPGDGPLESLLAELEPMPGTREELQRLARIAPDGSRRWIDDQVTEAALAEASGAVVHLGCHAFFLADPGGLPATPIDFDRDAALRFAGGLVLHRGTLAAIGGSRPDDDLLFPEEIARLPLDEVRLVTLSSCESGGGTPVSGEGILGLRRAFAQAGVDETLFALWPVSDRSTPAFMERFYRLALASDRSGQALWQAQGEMIPSSEDLEAFESAVLRYAPFVLCQSGPLQSGAEIEARSVALDFDWRYLAGLPLLAFLGAVVWRKTRRREDGSRFAE